MLPAAIHVHVDPHREGENTLPLTTCEQELLVTELNVSALCAKTN